MSPIARNHQDVSGHWIVASGAIGERHWQPCRTPGSPARFGHVFADVFKSLALSAALLASPALGDPLPAVWSSPEPGSDATDAATDPVTQAARWIASNSELPYPPFLPNLRYVDKSDMGPLFASFATDDGDAIGDQLAGSGTAEILAFYDKFSQSVYLPRGWTGETPAEMSMLIHEMVHHIRLHSLGNKVWNSGEEIVAFNLQDAWLREHGETLESALGISPLWVALASPFYY